MTKTNKRIANQAAVADDAEGSTAPNSPVLATKPKKTLSADHLRRMRDGRKGAVSTQARSKLVFPVSLLRRRLAKDKFAPRASLGASVWLAGALETLVVEVLDGVVGEAERMGKKCVTSQHVMAALKNDDEFQRIFRNVTIAKGGVGGFSAPDLLRAKRQPAKVTQPPFSSDMQDRGGAEVEEEGGGEEEDEGEDMQDEEGEGEDGGSDSGEGGSDAEGEDDE